MTDFHYMLDTNIAIYIIENRPMYMRERLNQTVGKVCVSSITALELYYGAALRDTPAGWDAVERFLTIVPVIDFDQGAALETAKIRAVLRKTGLKVGGYDLQIGGHAISQGLIIVTNNEQDFQRIDGLKIENWVTI